MTSVKLEVPDIHCGHCKMSIEGAVGELSGVDRVNVDVDGRSVDVAFDESVTSRAEIVGAIESQGYVVTE